MTAESYVQGELRRLREDCDRRAERTDKMYEDMYEGRGPSNPGVTMRLDRLEQSAIKADRRQVWIMSGLISILTALVGLIAAVINHPSH